MVKSMVKWFSRRGKCSVSDGRIYLAQKPFIAGGMDMSDKQNLNFSLLTQSEIDTLVGFLLEKKNGVDSSVLSQASIDKLIELLRYDEKHRKAVVLEESSPLDGVLSEIVTIRGDKDSVCEIRCAIDVDNVSLSIINGKDGSSMELTPEMVNEGDGDEWGRCIPPLTLHRLARALQVKYTAQTHEEVCQRFAQCLYGDETKLLPSLYLPEDEELLEILL
jgi:hypothetical protein